MINQPRFSWSDYARAHVRSLFSAYRSSGNAEIDSRPGSVSLSLFVRPDNNNRTRTHPFIVLGFLTSTSPILPPSFLTSTNWKSFLKERNLATTKEQPDEKRFWRFSSLPRAAWQDNVRRAVQARASRSRPFHSCSVRVRLRNKWKHRRYSSLIGWIYISQIASFANLHKKIFSTADNNSLLKLY